MIVARLTWSFLHKYILTATHNHLKDLKRSSYQHFPLISRFIIHSEKVVSPKWLKKEHNLKKLKVQFYIPINDARHTDIRMIEEW